MKQFIVYCVDRVGALDVRMANRPAHLEWANQFSDRILMAGPMFAEDGETFAGSVFVIEAESLEAVREWAEDDPYARANLFERVEIRPCKWLIGAGARP